MKHLIIVLCLIISLTGCDKVGNGKRDHISKIFHQTSELPSFLNEIPKDTEIDTRIIDDNARAYKRTDRVPSRNNVTGMYNGLYNVILTKEDKNKLHNKPVLEPIKDTYLYYNGTSYIPKVGSGGGVTIDEVDTEILIKTPDVPEVKANTAKVGISVEQATAIGLNTIKVGVSPEQVTAISDNSKKISYTDKAKVDINTAKISYTDKAKVDANTAKISYTDKAKVDANTAKVGITVKQASDITKNNAKVGITAGQATAITTNTTKNTTQDTAIGLNTAKPTLVQVQSAIDSKVVGKFANIDVVQKKILQGKNIKLVEKPDDSVEIQAITSGNGYWYENEITNDITCDSEVAIEDNLTVKGNIQFGNTFLMDVSKVNHTNNIPQFNPDTKQVDFIPLKPSTSRLYQVYDLDKFSLSEAEYKDGWITFGTNPERDYSNIELKTIMPPNCMSMTVYITYTHRGFGEVGGKPYPHIAFSADVGTSYNQGNDITVPIYNDIHFPQDPWHQGSKQMTVELQSFNLDRNEAKPITFSITPTGIIKDSKNYWILKGFAVGYTVYN